MDHIFFNRPIDHQSTSNDWLKPVMTTGLVNMQIGRSIANLVYTIEKMIQRSTVFHENSHVGCSHASEEHLTRSKFLWASSSRKVINSSSRERTYCLFTVIDESMV